MSCSGLSLAANESARHAVNGILRDIPLRNDEADWAGQIRRAPCRIFPLESRESDDLVFFKELDAELYARGLEHFIDILELDSVVSYLVALLPQEVEEFDLLLKV